MRFMIGVLTFLTLCTGAVFAEDAAKLYATKCASCHGKKGEGNPAMAKAKKLDIGLYAVNDEATLAKTDEALVAATRDGAGTPSASGSKPMPAYKGKISDDDITALVAYIRTLAPPPAGQ